MDRYCAQPRNAIGQIIQDSAGHPKTYDRSSFLFINISPTLCALTHADRRYEAVKIKAFAEFPMYDRTIHQQQ